MEPVLDGEAALGVGGGVERLLAAGGVADDGVQAELVGNLGAVVEHRVTVDGGVGVVGHGVAAGIAAEGVGRLGRIHVLDLLAGVVGGDVALQGEALDDFPAGSHAGDEALVVLQLLTGQDVPQILVHDGTEGEAVSPALGGVLVAAAVVVTVLVTGGGDGVLTDVGHVVEGAEHTGEVVGQTGDSVRTVLHVLVHVVDGVAELEGAVGAEVLASGEREVMLAQVGVVLVGHIVEESVGEAHAALVGTRRDGEVVLLGKTGAEQVAPGVGADRVELAGRAVKVVDVAAVVLCAEVSRGGGNTEDLVAVLVIPVVEAFIRVAVGFPRAVAGAGAVGGLVLRHVGDKVALDGSAELDVDAAVALALLHRDEDDAVSAFGTVQGGRGSALQDGEVLDILHVDVGQAVGLDALHGPVVAVVRFTVADRNTVHDDERLVGAGDGGQTADLDGDGAGGAAGGGADADTGGLAVEGGTQGRGDRVVQGLSGDGAHGVTDLLLVLADTEGGNDRSFQHFGVLVEDHVDVASVPGDDLGGVADAGDFDLVSHLGVGQGVGTVQVADCAVMGSLHKYGGPDNALARRILHRSLDGRLRGGRESGRQQGDHQGKSDKQISHVRWFSWLVNNVFMGCYPLCKQKSDRLRGASPSAGSGRF